MSTETVNSFLVDYSDAYILGAGDIKVVGANDNTRVAFKNCHLFIRAIIQLNDEHVDTSDNLDLTMNLYNLIEYSDNYAHTTGSLYHYNKPIQPKNNTVIHDFDAANVEAVVTSTSFKYHSDLNKKTSNSSRCGTK